MSGLKVVKTDAAGNPTPHINPAGYMAVTEKIILSKPGFKAFVGDHNGSGKPGKRAEDLQKVVQTNVPDAVVTTSNNNTPITKNNCQIKAVPDEDFHPGHKAKHTVPMPPTFLNSISYLDEYIDAFLALWNDEKKPEAQRKDEGRKFLYGIMMLTKCR